MRRNTQLRLQCSSDVRRRKLAILISLRISLLYVGLLLAADSRKPISPRATFSCSAVIQMRTFLGIFYSSSLL